MRAEAALDSLRQQLATQAAADMCVDVCVDVCACVLGSALIAASQVCDVTRSDAGRREAVQANDSKWKAQIQSNASDQQAAAAKRSVDSAATVGNFS